MDTPTLQQQVHYQTQHNSSAGSLESLQVPKIFLKCIWVFFKNGLLRCEEQTQHVVGLGILGAAGLLCCSPTEALSPSNG